MVSLRAWISEQEEEVAASSETALWPVSAESFLDRAASHERRGELQEALFLYREAASSEPIAAYALHRCGLLERQLGDTEAAVATLTRALHHCVDDAERTLALHVEIGDVHAQQGDYEEAAYFYRRAVRIDPGRDDVMLRLRYAARLSDSVPIPLASAG
jgi:tetratricopeptide (TPR) repeat protein